MESVRDVMPACLDLKNDMFVWWMECVRQGREDMIEEYGSESERRAICDRIFMQDRAYALRVCILVWMEAGKIAEKLILSDLKVDKTFEKYIHKTQNAFTPWMLVQLSEKYIAELARMTHDYVCEGGFSPILIKFQKYIRSHAFEPLLIEDIADALHISKSHLSHTIKKETGETVHRWILKEKVNIAKVMLSKQMYGMNEVWTSLGFCSQSHFAKCFRQATGMSPSQFKSDFRTFL